jgi:uridine kinase
MKTIGICGPSASGKTTLAKILCKDLDANLISLDNYFIFDPPLKKYEFRGMNWELPENLDWLAIKHDIRGIQSGKRNSVRKINWDSDVYGEGTLESKDWLIVEGFLLLHDVELLTLLDFTIYVDIPDHVGLTRRLARESGKRDYEINRKWFEEVTFPEYAPRRKVFEERADLVLNGEHSLADNIERIRLKISECGLD